MSEITFEQQIENGIEFYVSDDGETTGMSVRGLARCSGVDASTISKMVSTKEGLAKRTPKWLEPFMQQDFYVLAENTNAKIISSKVCARIITYYAYESKNAKNNIAKQTAEKFMEIGIDNWIKDLVGYSDNRLEKALRLLTTSVNGLKVEVEELKPIVKKYNKLKEGVTVRFPGVETLVNEAEERQSLLVGDKSNNLTLSDWLLTKRIKLDRGGYCKFGRMVAETFRSCKLEEPKKGNKKKRNGKWSNNVTLYHEEHYPILEMALIQFLQA